MPLIIWTKPNTPGQKGKITEIMILIVSVTGTKKKETCKQKQEVLKMLLLDEIQ